MGRRLAAYAPATPGATGGSTRQRVWTPRRVGGLVLSLLVLAALVYFSDAPATLRALAGARPGPIVLGLVVWFLGTLARTARWSYLLQVVGCRVRFLRLFQIYLSGLFLANITPGRVGDPVRLIFLSGDTGIRFSRGFPSLVVERVADTVVMLVIGLIGAGLLTAASRGLAPWLIASVVIYALAVLLVVAVLASRRTLGWLLAIFTRLFSFVPAMSKARSRLESSADQMHAAFAAYHGTLPFVVSMAGAVAIWLVDGATVYLAFQAVNIALPFWQVLLVTVVAVQLSVLTFLPGGLGSFEAIAVLLFSQLGADPLAAVTAAVLLARFMSFWLTAAVGALMLPAMNLPGRSVEAGVRDEAP